MPCRSDYMEPSNYEREISKVVCFLGELEGKPYDSQDLAGFHKLVYMRRMGKTELDNLTRELCSKLQSIDVTKYSLELQIWWRDHQRADKARLEQEQLLIETEAAKKAAMAKTYSIFQVNKDNNGKTCLYSELNYEEATNLLNATKTNNNNEKLIFFLEKENAL